METDDIDYQEIQGWFNARGLYLRTEADGDAWVALYGNRESTDVHGTGRGESRLEAARDAKRAHESAGGR